MQNVVWAGLTSVAGVLLVCVGAVLGSQLGVRYLERHPEVATELETHPDAAGEQVIEAVPPIVLAPLMIFAGTAIVVGGFLWLVVATVLWLA